MRVIVLTSTFFKSASRLNSRDAFVVRNTTTQMQYVWYGKALGQDMDKLGWIDELANNMNEFDETRGIVSEKRLRLVFVGLRFIFFLGN